MRRAAIPALALLLSACFSDPTAPVVASGSYSLQSVNGTALPFAFPNSLAIVSETLILDPTGTFTDVATRSDASVISDVGTYNVVGNTVTFGDQTINLLYQGQLIGSVLTTQIGTYTEVWQKH